MFWYQSDKKSKIQESSAQTSVYFPDCRFLFLYGMGLSCCCHFTDSMSSQNWERGHGGGHQLSCISRNLGCNLQKESSCCGRSFILHRNIQCGYLSFQCILLDTILHMRNECHIKKKKGQAGDDIV